MGVTSKRSRYILTLIALPLIGILLYTNRDTIRETLDLLNQLDKRWLLLLPAMQIGSYFSIAQYYRSFFQKFKKRVRFGRLFGLVFAMAFVNQILPSGGLSGVTYLINGVSNRVSSGVATLAQIGRYIFSYMTYFIVMAVALYLLLTGQPVESVIYGYMVGLVIVSIAGLLGVMYILLSRKRVDAVIGSLGRFVDWIGKKFRDGKPLFGRDQIQATLNELHDGVLLFTTERKNLLSPWIFMIFSTIFEVSIVLASFYIIGADVNPGVILVAYTIANAVGVVSVIPGDVGAHEASVIAVLALAGVPAAVAVSGTLLYRVFNKLLFLPVGFTFYSKLLKPPEAATG